MENTISLKITRRIECDVVVVGGGVGGCAAAAAAARHGADTVLLEATGCLGGQATMGLVTPLDARQSLSGIRFGGLLNEIVDRTTKLSQEYCVCGAEGEVWESASPHILKYVLLDVVDGAGAKIRFHTTLLSVRTEEKRIVSVIASDKSGLLEISAKTFIDATGDADLAALSGAETVLGSEPGVYDALTESGLNKVHFSDIEYVASEHTGLMQPVSIFFLMGNADVDKAMELNNKTLRFGDLGITRERFEAWKFAGTCGFEIRDDRIPMPQQRVLVSRSNRPDVAVINMSRVVNINGSDAEDLNRGEVLAQRQLIALVDFLKTFIPGFENAYYMQSGFTLGVRETRRMLGRHVLSGYDAIHCTPFDDVIARGSYIIDIHDPTGRARAIGGSIQGDCYDIPYGCIVSKTIPNLMACGRCISVDHVAHSSTRIMGTCMLTGQAAGTAAAMAIQQNCEPCELDVQHLRAQLRKNGMIL